MSPYLLAIFFSFLAVVSPSILQSNQNKRTLEDGCLVTDYKDVLNATANCLEIEINGLTVPGGQTLLLELQDGATLTFSGTITFEYYSWDGPFVIVTGNAITVQGAEGHVLDGQGSLWWDGIGDFGVVKPHFFKIKASGGSVFKNIKLLNCPHQCTSIDNCDGVTLTGWNIDCSDGDVGVAPEGKEGHNTDAFDLSHSVNVVITDSVVHNQDDCVCINQGHNMVFSNLKCTGSHGLSIAVGLYNTTVEDNTASNITFVNSTVINSMNGIHLKSVVDGGLGQITNITYKDITIINATNYGINVQQDYTNAGPTGTPNNNVNITDIYFENIIGNVASDDAMDVYILCGPSSCYDWTWNGISITGSKKKNYCNFKPDGFDDCSEENY